MINLGHSFVLPLELPQGSVPLSLQWLNPASFVLGKHHKDIVFPSDFNQENSLSVNELPVEITAGFWLSTCKITQAQWKAVGDLPHKNREKWLKDPEQNRWFENPNYHVYGMTWLEAMSFCRQLNHLFRAQLPKGYHFSLPTEVHWEYACLAGKEMIPMFVQALDGYKNVREANIGLPNDWGFYGMLGYTAELCYDVAASYTRISDGEYPVREGKILDWVGNKCLDECFLSFEERVIRGGVAPTYRRFKTEYMPSSTGFRVCLRPIIEWEYCDLTDPHLIEAGINILGD